MPTVEDALAIIDAAEVSEYPHTTADGAVFVSWKTIAFALFPKGSPHWKRPEGQPHGLDQSPAFEFMSRLGFDPRVRTIRGQYFTRSAP